MRVAILIILLATLLMLVRPASALQAQISNLSDLTLPSWSIGDPAISAHLDLCVYATGFSSGSYSVTVTSLGAFNLVNGLNHITYSLTWDDSGAGNLGGSGGAALTNAIVLTGRAHASTSSTSCSGGATARLNLKITQAAMSAALGGTYSDVLTIMIAPV